jgi:hypothetical protein
VADDLLKINESPQITQLLSDEDDSNIKLQAPSMSTLNKDKGKEQS